MTSPAEAALAVACEAGLWADTAQTLAASGRTVLLLQPAFAVAKVAAADDEARFAVEVEVAHHVQRRKGPVVPPLLRGDPGPHLHGGWVVSLWEYAPREADEAALAREAPTAWADLVSHLSDLPGPLPDFREAIRDCRRALSEGGVRGLPGSALRLLVRELDTLGQLDLPANDLRVLHGDPHVGNLTRTSGEILWWDLESVCVGPLEWDLTALPGPGHVEPPDPGRLARLRRIRSACVAVWCARKPSPSRAEREALAFHLGHLGHPQP